MAQGSGKIKARIFSTSDPFNNQVVLYQKTWEHIAGRHDEMVGHEAHVQQAVEDPDRIKTSTNFADVFAFERTLGTSSGELRVFIQYENADFMKGGTTGRVDTAYPVDPNRKPKIGKEIYVRTASTAPTSPANAKEKEK
jgi:hypothetical protein